MSRDLYSPTKLTEFPRKWDDEPAPLLTKLKTKLTNAYNTSYNIVNGAPSYTPTIPEFMGSSSTDDSTIYGAPVSAHSINTIPEEAAPSGASVPTNAVSRQVENTSIAEIEHVNENDTRTSSGILSNIFAMKNSNLSDYKDTELSKLWMPDSKSKECYECGSKFTIIRRKHHCRLCGQIFCYKCCSQMVTGKIIEVRGNLKVCTYCSKVVLSYLKTSEINTELQSDLQALQNDLSIKLSSESADTNNPELSVNSPLRRKASVGYQEERLISYAHTTLTNTDRKNILQQSNSLKTLHDDMTNFLPIQNRGSDLIKYLINHQKSSNKTQAIAILLAMIEAGFLLATLPETTTIDFDEDRVYRLALKTDLMQGSTVSFQLDLNLEHNSALLSRPISNDQSLDSNIDHSAENAIFTLSDTDLESSLLSSAGSKSLLEAYCYHEELLVHQLLLSESLDVKWSKILIPLCARVANRLKPDQNGSDLRDIRSIVNFKKVPGGKREESTIIPGVVISKNVAHKEMANYISKPKVLLLQCAIVYQRNEGVFVNLETLMMQEEETLRNITRRIVSLNPNVVLVHKNVARLAQDMLRQQGITLVLNVKLSVMERIARCLNCDVLSSIDSNIGRPKLGQCDSFRLRTFVDDFGHSKTLMYFEVASAPKNCGVLLRGGSNVELTKVKKVASFLTFARYNWRLELSFLLDIFATPPPTKGHLFDSSDVSPIDFKEVKQPIKAPKIVRKSEESRTVNIENVEDFSDPLRKTDLSPSVFDEGLSLELEVHTPYDNKFRTALGSIILSVSPFMSFPLPYLETEIGRKCLLRARFPPELYYSKQWSTPTYEKGKQTDEVRSESERHLKPAHEFVNQKIVTSMDNKDMQNMLARFRACGGRFPKNKSMVKTPSQTPIVQKVHDDILFNDALAIENHQKISVLFCSYICSLKASTSIGQQPSFCTQPLLLDMHFYGSCDIMLGQFLERYCFHWAYICNFCNLPMMEHVRRYVHSMGCIQVDLMEEPKKSDSNSIYVTTFCKICNEYSPSVPLSNDTRCWSFAKYLEMRFHNQGYRRRRIEMGEQSSREEGMDGSTVSSDFETSCPHSLNQDHVHSFNYNGITARFNYTSIESWEIFLPRLIVILPQEKPVESSSAFQEDIKALSQNGYEVYAKIYDKLAQLSCDVEIPLLTSLKAAVNNDQVMFKSRVEVVHTLLTEKNITVNEINDSMLLVKRVLAESVESWGPKLHEAAIHVKNLTKLESQQPIDSGTICTEDLKSDDDTEDRPKEQKLETEETLDLSTKSTTKKVNDEKKSVISNILNQFLSSTGNNNVVPSPIPLNEHHNLPLGSFPIVVNDQDISSIISHALISNEYKKALENMTNSSKEESNSPSVRRKNLGSVSTEDEEKEQIKVEEKDKKSKSSHHCEAHFHDSTTHFTCKVYYAKEFEAMRSSFLQKFVPEKSSTDRKSSSNSLANKNLDKTDSRSKINLDAWKSSETEEIRKAFVRSISQSLPWDAKGGKSGSRFSKTIDTRFVLKEMSRTDVAIFDNFAPNYFEYINNCLATNQPTLLAKIFGVFKVIIKKKDSEEKNVLVMENLFYNRNISNKFDLKGSERNRLVDTSNQQGEIVLMDENLIQMAWSNPLYILSHSKTILREAIFRDAAFLAKNDVMDYSLLVGMDSDEKMLVLGIIDYIRTFTFDKKLESLVKQTVGQGKLPTVISPKNYKQRFIDSMERYFLVIPDRWEGLSKK